MTTLSNWEVEAKFPVVTSCKQAAQLINVSLERRLTLREMLTMWIHLTMCKTCSFYRRQIKALRQIFIRHEEVLEKIPPSEDEKLSPSAKIRISGEIEKNL